MNDIVAVYNIRTRNIRRIYWFNNNNKSNN